MMKKAIVVVDELYDFIDGSLACGHAEEAVGFSPDLLLSNPGVPAMFICDHHPANHSSFEEFGGIWPPHCVTGTRGSEIHDSLKPFAGEEFTFYKGCDPAVEQYSGFEARNVSGRSLGEVLLSLGVKRVILVGIATEYCVYNTAADLMKAGFAVEVCPGGLAYVDISGHNDTLAKMVREGIIMNTDE